MSRKDRYALVVGLVLGIISGALTILSLFAAGLVFLACCILSPLIVSLVADNRIMTLSLVPNLVLALIALIFLAYINYSMSRRYELWETLLGILLAFVVAVGSALAMSWLVKRIRSKR